ncbi:MAG: GGDEF domain-containing protein [Candidatus Omnitrophota bacterium]
MINFAKQEEKIRKIPKGFIILLGYIMVLLLGVLDYYTGYRLGFSIFYVLPITMLIWFCHRDPGIVLAVFSAIVWYTADVAARGNVQSYFILIWNTVIRLSFFLIIAFFLSALKETMEREKAYSRIDYLTGLANFRFFSELAEGEISRSKRYNRGVSVAYIDLDNFKTVNDKFGHKRGNELLRIVADNIKRSIRIIDIPSRLGGDEFVILMPETNHEQCEIVLKRMRQNLLEAMKEQKVPVTFSIGAVSYTAVPDTVEQMISAADDMMYKAKKSGKNKIISIVA